MIYTEKGYLVSSKTTIFELRAKGLTYAQISTQTGLSKATISYHCSTFNDPQKTAQVIIDKIQPLYDELGSANKVAKVLRISSSTVKRYAVMKITQPMNEAEKSGKNVQRVITYRRRMKQKLVEDKGGSCEMCGYNKSHWALQFHHRDPKEKEFMLTGKSWSYERLKKEADKCVLLCANCHLEEHERLSNISIEAELAQFNDVVETP